MGSYPQSRMQAHSLHSVASVPKRYSYIRSRVEAEIPKIYLVGTFVSSTYLWL